MQTSHSQYDADRMENRINYTKFRTAVNEFPLNCGSCNQTMYVDKQTFESVTHAIEEGLDSPFLCDDCQDEYAEIEHTGSH